MVKEIAPATYAVIGASSVLAGYSRLSFSLAVIMLETTENVNLFLPIITTLFVSFIVGGFFNKSLYENAVGFKNLPFLAQTVPRINREITASDIMARPVACLKYHSKVSSIYSILKQSKHNAFPILNSSLRCVGLISRHNLIVILKNIDRVPAIILTNKPESDKKDDIVSHQSR